MPVTANKTNLKPLGDKVIVEIIDEPRQSSSGIYLPDTAREKSQRGKVLSVGPGKVLDSGEREPMDVKEGDIVMFAKYGGNELSLDGQELMILSLKDIHAIIE